MYTGRQRWETHNFSYPRSVDLKFSVQATACKRVDNLNVRTGGAARFFRRPGEQMNRYMKS